MPKRTDLSEPLDPENLMLEGGIEGTLGDLREIQRLRIKRLGPSYDENGNLNERGKIIGALTTGIILGYVLAHILL